MRNSSPALDLSKLLPEERSAWLQGASVGTLLLALGDRLETPAEAVDRWLGLGAGDHSDVYMMPAYACGKTDYLRRKGPFPNGKYDPLRSLFAANENERVDEIVVR